MNNAPWRQLDSEERWLAVLGTGQRWLPAATIAAASLVALVPLLNTITRLPDLGFLMLLAWRLYRPDLMPSWIGLPLGLFADLVSANPPGVAATLWPATLLLIDIIEQRVPLGSYGLDWAVAAMTIPGYMLIARLIAGLVHPVRSLEPILPQAGAMILLFPLIARVCAAIEQRWLHPR